MKILPVGAELFRSDGLTVMTKVIGDFRRFANAPKNTIQIGVHFVDFKAPQFYVHTICIPYKPAVVNFKSSPFLRYC